MPLNSTGQAALLQLPPGLKDHRALLLRHPAAQWAAGIHRLHRGHSAEIAKSK